MSQIIPLFKPSNPEESAVKKADKPKLEKFFVFSISDRFFALPAVDVTEVASYSSLIEIPKTSELVSGVVNVRGTVIPILNLRKRLGLDENIYVDEVKSKILYFSLKQGYLVGMIVDDIEYRLREAAVETRVEESAKEKELRFAVIEEKDISRSYPIFSINEMIEPSEITDIEAVLKSF